MNKNWIAGALLAAFAFTSARAAETMDPKLRTAGQRATDRGLHFLREKQGEDGSYFKSVGMTGLVLRGFLDSYRGYNEGDGPFVTRSVDYLVKNQGADGAMSETPMNRSYNNALALAAIATLKNPKYKDVIGKSQDFLKKHQTDESEGYDPSHRYYGGIGYGGDERPDMTNTSVALSALAASSLDPKDPVWAKAQKFVSRAQNRTESNDQKGWVGNDGGFIYMPGTNTDPYEGTKSYGAITAAGLLSLILTGADKKDPRVVAAYDWIKKNYTLDTNPNTGSAAGLYYYYWAYAQAMSAMGDTEIVDGKGQKHNWRNELVEKLLSRQNPDGSWVNKDNGRFMQDNPVLVTAWAVNALNFALKQ